jgi:hypothetical protein
MAFYANRRKAFRPHCQIPRPIRAPSLAPSGVTARATLQAINYHLSFRAATLNLRLSPMDSPQLNSRSTKILEIGVVRLLSVALNDQVRFVDTRFSILPTASTVARLRQAFKQALALRTEIRRAEYGLVMCRAFGRFAWSKDNPFITNVIRWIMRQFMAFCVSRRLRSAELVIVDIEDKLTLEQRDLQLLRQCHLYFKRELAQNAWTNLLRVQPPRGEYHHEFLLAY